MTSLLFNVSSALYSSAVSTTSPPAPMSTSTILSGSICTPRDLMSPEVFLHCLTFKEGVGLTVVTTSGFISLFAVLYFFVRVLAPSPSRPTGNRHLVTWPMDVYMLSLFSANLLHAVGAAISTQWLHEGKVHTGLTCWAQGLMLGSGATMIGLTTLVIAVHTFLMVFWGIGVISDPSTGDPAPTPISVWIARMVVITLWLLTIVLSAALAAEHRSTQEHFYGPRPFWCFVSAPRKFALALEYLWLWMALCGSIITYIPLFCWYINQHGPTMPAIFMLLYPFVYSVLVIPLSVVRWIAFYQLDKGVSHLPPSATLGVETLFNLIGFVDVVLFFTTRQGLLLIDAQ